VQQAAGAIKSQEFVLPIRFYALMELGQMTLLIYALHYVQVLKTTMVIT